MYVAGKQDWLAFDLPFEGSLAESRTAAHSAIKDVPVCGPLDRVGEVRRRAQQAGWQECIVTSEKRVVLGLLQNEAWLTGDEVPAQDAMDPAPLTLRPHLSWESVLEKMHAQETNAALVTKPDGKLIGLLRYNRTN